jgi:beta-galactosidase
LRLTPDRNHLSGDGCGAVPITVEAIDADGRPVPTAGPIVEFELIGSGAIIGLGNGDPNCHEPEKGNRHSLFNGLAQVIVQSQRDASGNITLRAKSDGLKPAELTIEVKPAPARPSVPKVARDGRG